MFSVTWAAVVLLNSVPVGHVLISETKPYPDRAGLRGVDQGPRAAHA